MKIKRSNSFYHIILFFIPSLLIAAILFTGCKTKQKNSPADKTVEQQTASKKDTSTTVKPEIMQMTGTWRGLFDKRSAILSITEQTGENFKGKITINYRQPLKQEVSGTINTKTMAVEMKDLLHSRYQGKYSGKISDDGMKFSGVFTMSVGGNKYNFEFKKQ